MQSGPQIRRYVLVPGDDARNGESPVRRFSLARLSVSTRSALGADRLERLEQVAWQEPPQAGRPGGDQ